MRFGYELVNRSSDDLYITTKYIKYLGAFVIGYAQMSIENFVPHQMDVEVYLGQFDSYCSAYGKLVFSQRRSCTIT